jgi:hypothetical protein
MKPKSLSLIVVAFTLSFKLFSQEATIIDKSNNRYEVTKFRTVITWDMAPNTYLMRFPGKHGESNFELEFSKISEITFLDDRIYQNRYLLANIKLTNGVVQERIYLNNLNLSGEYLLGNFNLRMDRVRRIVFNH